jgi:hypothetical protein
MADWMESDLLPSSAQAQAQLEAELALFSFPPSYNRLRLHYNRLRFHYNYDSLFGSFYASRCRQTSKLGILGILKLVTCQPSIT